MGIGADPNSVKLVRATLAELRRISRANGYFVDVRTVKQPDYAPYQQDGLIPKAALMEEAPAILVWVDSETDDGSGDNSAEDQPELHIQMLIVGKQEVGLQDELQRMAASVRIAMRHNLSRNFPDSVAENTWGLMTQGDGKTFDYFYEQRPPAETTIGVVHSRWRIRYRSPVATAGG